VGLKKTKLVTHCRNSSQAEQFVFLEYLIYKIYNILSDESYQVRLAKIHWIDTQGDYEAYQKWGFIIENTQQLEARLGGKFINIQTVHQDKTNYDKITRLALFEFMIGNTDWGVSSLHNIKLLINDPYKPPIAIPYDFDWSGFVNAPYAVPLPDFGTKSVRVRVYRGYYRQMDELNRVITEFLEKKDSIFELVQNFSYLNEANKSQALDYLMEFYSIIENPKRIHKEFIENCRDEN
jgi:hypothetical protein